MEAINNLIPITAVVALALFISKEVIEYIKKTSERKRQLEVYKMLISEEIRENYFALELLNKVLKAVVKAKDQNIEEKLYHVNTDRYGNEYIHIALGENSEKGRVSMFLRQFSTTVFDTHLPELAKLDKELFESMKSLYEDIRQWKAIRNDLVCFLADEIQDVRDLFLGFNFKMLKADMGPNFGKLRDAHIQLTGLTIKADAGKVEAVKL